MHDNSGVIHAVFSSSVGSIKGEGDCGMVTGQLADSLLADKSTRGQVNWRSWIRSSSNVWNAMDCDRGFVCQ